MFWIIFFGIVFFRFSVFCTIAFLKEVDHLKNKETFINLFIGFGISLLLVGIFAMNVGVKTSYKNVPRAIDVARGYAYPKYNVELIDSCGVKVWNVKDTVFVYREGYNRNNTK